MHKPGLPWIVFQNGEACIHSQSGEEIAGQGTIETKHEVCGLDVVAKVTFAVNVGTKEQMEEFLKSSK